MSVFALQSQLPLLGLQLGISGLLLFLQHHSTLENTIRAKLAWNNDSGVQDGSRNNCLIIRGRRPYRWLHSEESGAVVWAAVTSGSPVANTVQVVVECQLCTCKNISQHTGLSACSERKKNKWTRQHATVSGNSPVSMSQRAKSPMCTSPFTVHFCVSQFGLQLWFINRDKLPFCAASMTRSYEAKLSRD